MSANEHLNNNSAAKVLQLWISPKTTVFLKNKNIFFKMVEKNTVCSSPEWVLSIAAVWELVFCP